MPRIDRPNDTSYLVVCSNNVSVLHHFLDTTTFRERATACNLEKYFFLADRWDHLYTMFADETEHVVVVITSLNIWKSLFHQNEYIR